MPRAFQVISSFADLAPCYTVPPQVYRGLEPDPACDPSISINLRKTRLHVTGSNPVLVHRLTSGWFWRFELQVSFLGSRLLPRCIEP
jgi:hypothetical protein